MPESEKKTKMLCLRYYPHELEELDARASAVGLTRSAYIRRKIAEKPLTPPQIPPVNWSTYQEIGQIARALPAIGNNINQIARALNAARFEGELLPHNFPGLEYLAEILETLEKTQALMKETRLQLCGAKPMPRSVT